jgi:monoamine oxidase
VKTFHTTADGSPFQDPKQYAEAGAMRIPTSHKLVLKLIDMVGLTDKLQTFYNIDVENFDDPAAGRKPDKTPRPKAYRAWLKTNGIQARRILYNDKKLPPGERTMGFPVSAQFASKAADELLSAALAEPNALIDKSTVPEKIEGWKQLIARYDNDSMLTFLRRKYPSDDAVIDYMGTLQNLTSRLFLSFIHSFVDTFYISPGTSYLELDGGNWQLPYALLPDVQDDVVMDARAIEIQWAEASRPGQAPKAVHRGRPGVYVRTLNEPPVKRGMLRPGRTRVEQEFTADYLLVTVPFSALRFIEVAPQFSYEKRRAIIELHYDSATKVLLEFSERFWEWDEAEWRRRLPGDEYRGHGSFGGGSITDTPNRFIYYPSHTVEGSSGGVILASYTWADEANRWDSIPAADRYNYALKGLTSLYGRGIKRYFTGFGATESWMENYFSFGEAAVFSPGQMTALHPHIPKPEGPVHFAGEHTSLKHAWIEGAIESAIRAALEIHGRASHG